MRTVWFIGSVWLLGGQSADLRFTDPSVNLGEIRGGREIRRTFTFTNAGNRDIEITEVRPGCGCMAPRLSAKQLKPGEQGTLDIDLRTLGQAEGPHTWTAHVRYRSGNSEGELPLRISAYVINDIQLQPASLRLISRGAMTQELTLVDTRPQPLRIESLHTSSPFLKARVVGQARTDAGHRQIKLALELAATCPVGQHSETLAIHTTDAEYRTLVVPVAVTMESAAALAAQPSLLEIRTLPDRPPLTKFVRVQTSLPGTVSIEKVEADHAALTCTWSRGPGSAATIRVRVAGGLSERLEATLRVHVASPRPEILQVPVRVEID